MMTFMFLIVLALGASKMVRFVKDNPRRMMDAGMFLKNMLSKR